MEVKKINLQKWIPFEKIYNNGVIKINKNKYIKIIKITPINYNLKSDLEKKSILNSYKIFLKTCNFNFQILIQSRKEDLSQNIINIQKNTQKKNNKYLESISKQYFNFIQSLNKQKKSSSKNFYIVIENNRNNINLSDINLIEIINNDLEEKYFKIKECLNRCGNAVEEINKKEDVINILYSFFCTRKYVNKN